MTRSIRSDFKTTLAQLLLDDIQLNRNQYHYFLGKTTSWSTSTDVPSDTIQSSGLADIQARNDATFFKKIDKNDVSLAVKRYDWVYGEIVPMWDHTIDMTGIGFYRLVDETYVYVCLDNAYDTPSTVKPTGTSSTVFMTSDGYLWKFLYKVPAFKRRNFSTTMYMPVQRAITDSFYNKGSIDSVTITDGGSGYIDASRSFINVIGGNISGSGAKLTIQSVDQLGKITGVYIDNSGSNYHGGCRLIASSGIGADISPTIINGEIVGVTIIHGGTNYSPGETITAYVGPAVIKPMLQQIGQIVDVQIIDTGIGYTSPPALTVGYTGVSELGTPTGLYDNNISARFIPVMNSGRISRVLVADPGINYPIDQSTQIIVQGDGTGAKFTPVIHNGSIIDVVIEDPGEGYTYANLIVDGAGTGAQLHSVFNTADFNSEQSIIEQTAIPGAIHQIKLIDRGSYYNENTTQVTVTGDGVGCAAVARVDPETKQIQKIEIIHPGRDYTYANVTIIDEAGASNAIAKCILPPPGGHGADVVQHLSADVLAISSPLSVDVTLFQSAIQFRQFGVMRNLRTAATGKIFRGNRDIAAYDIEYAATNPSMYLIPGSIIKNNSTQYRVLSQSSDNMTARIQPITARAESPVGQLYEIDIDSVETGAQFICTSVTKAPIVDKYTGNLLYISNEPPFTFFETQGLLVKTFLKF